MATGSIALGPRFEAWKEKHEQTDEQLATYLGITVDVLATLAAEGVPNDGQHVGFRAPGEDWSQGVSHDPDRYQLQRLADRYHADERRLFYVVGLNEMRLDQ